MFSQNLKDISICNNTIQVSKSLNFTLQNLESQIQQISYHGNGLKKFPEIENAQLPPFIQVFYYFIFENAKIPSVDEFFSTYTKWFGGITEDNKILLNNCLYNATGVKNRLFRTYPSLVRDFHFYVMLSESNRFDKVLYSLRADYQEGIDLKVITNNKEFCISILISTVRGEFFKLKKQFRHDYTNTKEIILKAHFNSLKRAGDVYLLTQNHLKKVLDEINDINAARTV